MRDIKNKFDYTQSLVPASRSAVVNGSGVDLRGYGSACVVLDIGAVGGTTPSFTFEVQESDDNSAFTAVDAGNLQGAIAAITDAEANSVVRVGYLGTKRYIRAAITAVSGTSPTILCSSGVARGNAELKPSE